MADFRAPKPFYRSRLFWLGLPGLVFLLWGWADWGRPSSLTIRGGDIWLSVGNYAGTLRTVWKSGPQTFAISGRTGTRAPDLIHLFPRPIRYSALTLSGAAAGDRYRTLSIAYWFLILVYLTLWLGGLAGWQRRKARLLKASAAVPPP